MTMDANNGFQAVERKLDEIKREAREERKEMRDEIKGLRFEVGTMGKDVAQLKERTEGLPKVKEKVAALNAKNTLFVVVGATGFHALMKYLGK